MAAVHAYATFVSDSDTGIAASVGTINLEALADQELAHALISEKPDADAFIRGLGELSGENGEPELRVKRVYLPDNFSPTSDGFLFQISAVLSTDNLDDAVSAWYSGELPDGASRVSPEFAVSLLESTVLAEYSDAAAKTAAGAVGVACAGGATKVVVALVAAGAVGAGGGVALLIAAPVGIVLLGVGATAVTYRLFTHKRRPQPG
jgi:hypothetical protein